MFKSILANRAWQLVAAVILLGASGWLPAQAQGRTDTASFTLSNAHLENVGGTVLGTPRQIVLVSLAYPNRNHTLVQNYWQDERLRLRRQTQLTLPGHLDLAAVQGARHYMLVQLLTRDSLVLATVDTAGRLLAQVRQPLAMRRRLLEVHDLSLPQTDYFLTTEQQTKQGSFRLVCRAPNLAVRWEKSFGPDATLAASAADSTHLWLVLMADYQGRHPVSTAVCLDLATGAELGQVALTNEQARRVPSVVEMGPGHSLLVAGHAFGGEAAVLRRSGDLFFQRLSPTGQVLADHLTNFEREPTLHGAGAERVQWQLLWPLAQGQVHLIGETYTSTSAGGGILAASVTMGIAGQTVLRPKDIVSVRLGAAGQVEQLRIVPLPLDKGSFAWPYYAQGRVMARMATEAGTFRVRGLTDDSTHLVLRSPQQIQTLDLRSGQLSAVRPAPDKGQADVLYIGSNFVIIGEARPARHILRLVRVPLAASR